MLRDKEQPCATNSSKYWSDTQLLDLRTSPIIRLLRSFSRELAHEIRGLVDSYSFRVVRSHVGAALDQEDPGDI